MSPNPWERSNQSGQAKPKPSGTLNPATQKADPKPKKLLRLVVAVVAVAIVALVAVAGAPTDLINRHLGLTMKMNLYPIKRRVL
uniref:Uncharacterized protein n=1 Tax=Planktothrix agardhii TaxID=1160 RepID=A0A1J1JLD6_PLAAG|nr:exported protein of unknown function [Planktothrix agardhii]